MDETKEIVIFGLPFTYFAIIIIVLFAACMIISIKHDQNKKQ